MVVMLSWMAASTKKPQSRSRVPAGSMAHAADTLASEPDPASTSAARSPPGSPCRHRKKDRKQKTEELGPDACRPASSLHVKPDK